MSSLLLDFQPVVECQDTSLIDLVNMAYRGEASHLGWTTEADLIEGPRLTVDLLKDMCTQGIVFKVYRQDMNHLLVGAYFLKPHAPRAYVGMLTVHPAQQNQGLGKALLNHAETYVRAKQCQSLYMHVIEQRGELIAFYERLGYQKTGERVPFPQGPSKPKFPLEIIVLEKTFIAE